MSDASSSRSCSLCTWGQGRALPKVLGPVPNPCTSPSLTPPHSTAQPPTQHPQPSQSTPPVYWSLVTMWVTLWSRCGSRCPSSPSPPPGPHPHPTCCDLRGGGGRGFCAGMGVCFSVALWAISRQRERRQRQTDRQTDTAPPHPLRQVSGTAPLDPIRTGRVAQRDKASDL